MKYCPQCGCPCEETETVCMICQSPLNHKASAQKVRTASTKVFPEKQPRQIPINSQTAPDRIPHRKKNKQKSLVIPVLLLLLIAISSLAYILYSFLSKSDDAESFQGFVSSEIEQTSSQSGTTFSEIDKPVDTIYVSDGRAYRYLNGYPTIVYSYEFSEDGVPICEHMGWSDKHDPASTTYYIFADDTFAKKTAQYASESLDKEAEEYRRLSSDYAKIVENEIRKNGFIIESQGSRTDYRIFGFENDHITTVTDAQSGTELVNYVSVDTITLHKWNSFGKVEESSYYSHGAKYRQSSSTFLSDGRIDSNDSIDFWGEKRTHSNYIYGSNAMLDSVTDTTTWYDGSTTTTITDYIYGENNLLIKTDMRNDSSSDMVYSYHFISLDVPHSCLEKLEKLYSQLGIIIIQADDKSTVYNSISEEEMAFSLADS